LQAADAEKNTENVEIETQQQNVRTPHTAAGAA